MATRYASHGTTVRRSIRNSVVAPWWTRPRHTLSATALVFPTYGASAHVKGTWSQVTASLSADTAFIYGAVTLSSSGVDTATLLDIGVGAAGSETVVVANVAVGGHNSLPFVIPIAIASGSRIAVRIQGTRTSPTGLSSGLILWLYGSESYAFLPTSVDVIGSDTATSYGTTLSGSSGSWSEITSSTSKDYQALVMIPSLATSDVPATNTVEWTLGVGAAGSEVAVLANLYRSATSEAISNGQPLVAGGCPAGSRLSVKHNFSANPERYAAVVIGVPYV